MAISAPFVRQVFFGFALANHFFMTISAVLVKGIHQIHYVSLRFVRVVAGDTFFYRILSPTS
jgi:hypothetical protein